MSVSTEQFERPSHRRLAAGLAWFLLGLTVARRRAGTEHAPQPGQPPGKAHVNPRAALAEEPDRGRAAAEPQDIPARGWKDIAFRTWKEIGADDVATLARSIAFSGMLALFPALAAFVSIYGLFADVGSAREHLAALTGIVPASAMTFIGEQMVRIAQQKDASLSFTFLLSLLLSIWSANAGMKALFKGLNVAYEEEEKRNFLKLNLVTLAFTVGAIALFTLAIAAMVAVPAALDLLGVGLGGRIFAMLRWPALAALITLGLSVVYRYGPSRDKPQWSWVTWGGAVAAVLWLAASLLFSWYLTNFGHYNETYGSLGAVFGFMMWMWLSAVVILAGAELNSEMEHQTAADTTAGPALPMGARGARVADTVGASQKGFSLPKTGRPPEG